MKVTVQLVEDVGGAAFGSFEAWFDPFAVRDRVEMRAALDNDALKSSGIDPQINDNKYGHANSASYFQEEFGIVATPLISAGGLVYEAVHIFFPGHPPGEQTPDTSFLDGLFDGQHPINWLYDTPGDIAANTFGQVTGILSSLGIGDPSTSNRATLMIPGPDYTGGPETWKLIVPSGYVYPVPSVP